MTNIIFFGPPGAGKGTQAKLISEQLKLSHLSTGEILRKKTLDQDTLALKLKEIMSSGKLVSDDILNSIVSERLKKEGDKGFILDGYPRTLLQSNFKWFPQTSNNEINYIFNIQIKFETLKDRILKRSSEESRDDDNIEALQTRYSEYLNSTEKVSALYKQTFNDIFFEIDGALQIEEITNKIKEILKNSWKSAKITDIFPWLIV